MRKLVLVVLLLFVISGVSAQAKKGAKPASKSTNKNSKAKQLPSLTLGVGVLSFNGDVGKGLDLTSLGKVRGGYSIALEQRVGKALGFSLNGIYGKLADSQNDSIRNYNFQSNIIQGDLNVLFHFDNDFLFKRSSTFAPYIGVGIGYLKFDSYSDMKDKNGVAYNYWKDGTIHAHPDGTIGDTVMLHRDYKYETKLNDSAKYTNGSLSIPLTFGVNLKLSDRVAVNLAASYYLTMTDWIDNIKDGANDKYLYAKFGLKFNFGKGEDSGNPIYETVDFSSLDKIDSDGDGVKDANDMCPGTPKKVKVTSDGCPEDNDADGVPDYKDKEPLTKPGAMVDEQGVTLTEKMIADKQKEFSAQATERSNLFNENPSLGYLKDVEAKFRQNGGKRSKGAIPVRIRSADLNSDGYISTEEISKAIDSFFEGDSDFTVEKLNDLIDFFFEQ